MTLGFLHRQISLRGIFLCGTLETAEAIARRVSHYYAFLTNGWKLFPLL